jgi:hypothetical protein
MVETGTDFKAMPRGILTYNKCRAFVANSANPANYAVVAQEGAIQ